jgi:Tfp pilus assembly protein PilX
MNRMNMQQKGFALVGVLIVLIIMSVMAISLGKFSVGFKQGASANTSGLYSNATADNGVRYAQYLIYNDPAKLNIGASGAIATVKQTDNWWLTAANWSCASCATKSETLTVDSRSANYHIEKLDKSYLNMEADEDHGIVYYRVLSKATGVGSAETILISYSGLFE